MFKLLCYDFVSLHKSLVWIELKVVTANNLKQPKTIPKLKFPFEIQQQPSGDLEQTAEDTKIDLKSLSFITN